MFKKAPTIKPLAALRGSDRRKTADLLISELGLEVPAKDDTDPEAKAAATAAHTSLRASLLPENSLSARFITTHGPDLKQVSGAVYVGAPAGEDQRIIWVKHEDRMYPTVHTLWRNPGLIPLLHTPSIVIDKLKGGADLMTPGLARGPPFPEKAKNGTIVAIASTDSPTVPMAVGVCEIDISTLGDVRGAKGHAVRIVHWYGDEAWGWSPAGKAPGHCPDHLEGWDTQDEDTLVEKFQAAKVDEVGGVPLDGENGPEKVSTAETKGLDEEDLAPEASAQTEPELTTQALDEIFWQSFLYGVHHYKTTNKDDPNHGLVFPLTASFVMSTLIQPFLPAFTSSQANAMQIKKTSWKNVRKFIKALDKAMIVKAKDRDGNNVVILDIDFEDEAVLNFVPYQLPKKETAAGASLGRGEKANVTTDPGDSSIRQRLKKIELYRSKEKLSNFFPSNSAGSKQLYTSQELRQVVTDYVESENLISSTNKRLVNLDPFLANGVFDSNTALDKEVIAKGSVPRDALIDRVIKACSPFWVVLRNDETMENSATKPKAGAAPRIQIRLETRSGNKTVTKVSGVEAYFIAPQPLADELRKTCAGSTSVDRLAGSSPKTPIMEILVQGPQKDAVYKALEKRGVNRSWVDVEDKTKGKKKG